MKNTNNKFGKRNVKNTASKKICKYQKSVFQDSLHGMLLKHCKWKSQCVR